MKNIIIIVCLLSGLSIKAQVLLKLENDTLNSYSYSGGDEFNKTSINENAWDLLPYPKTNMGQFFSFDRNNTTIENGVAVFTVKEKDSLYTISPPEVDSNFIKRRKISLDNHQYRMKYTAGIVISKQKYHYGFYELRFKVEKGKGVWPAFWFFGGNKNEEIDVFELKGEKNNKIHVDTHCPYGCDRGYKNKLGFKTNWGDWMPVGKYLHEGFNVMALDWKQNELMWYINGYPLAYFKGSFPNPMNLYLNTQVASEFSAFQPPPDKTTVFPNNFYVDYIRVWKKNPVNTKPVLKITREFTVSDRFPGDYANRAMRHSGLMYIKQKFKNEEGTITLTLLDRGKLIVNVLGELSNRITGLTLKGSAGTYTLNSLSKESEITLNPNDKELELIINTGKKQYSQKITVE